MRTRIKVTDVLTTNAFNRNQQIWQVNECDYVYEFGLSYKLRSQKMQLIKCWGSS